MSLTSWDIETGIITAHKRKGTPFGDLNWCVIHGWKHASQPAVHRRYFGHARPDPGWLREVLQPTDSGFKTRLLVGFNIKFDLLHALQDQENLELWMAYVAGGGNVWDCQLAEYLLNGMDRKEHMLSLDEVAPRYGGNLKFDEVKALWAAGVNTPDIDPTLLTRYLCGEGEELGDVGNTEKIALGQIARARAANQVNSIMLNMGSLLCTIEMERNGMFVDKERGLVLAAQMAKELEELQLSLAAYLPRDIPFDFNWNSRYHKSALIFGGTIRWDAHEYDVHPDNSVPYSSHGDGVIYRHEYEARKAAGLPVPRLLYSQKDEEHYLLVDGTTMECREWERASLDEWLEATPPGKDILTFTSGKRAGEFKTKKVKGDNLDKPKGRGVKAPYTFHGYTAPEKEWESSTEPGVYSTASEVIDILAKRGIPFLKAFGELQSLAKDLGTYYITVDEDGNEKGMLSLVDALGIIHHRINHTNTVTGRFSSSDPNLQNIAKGVIDALGNLVKGSQIKTLFVSRFGEDGKIIQSDFTALEVYVQAILTRCQQLIEDLRAGLDMHCVRVSQKEKRPYDEVFKLCKGWKDADGTVHDADPEWDRKRTKAKVFSFQRAYGAGAQKISDSTGMPLEEVEALILAETERYPEIDAYYADITGIIKASRRPPPYPVPHPSARGVMCHLGTGHYRTPDGKLYSYTEQPSPEYLLKRGTFQSFSPTEIKNYVVQGTGGEWAKAAMWLAIRAFYARRNFGHRALLVNQVHDALYADSHNKVAFEAAALLHACMEGASDFMEWFFNWPCPVPVPSDTTWGASMMDEQRIDGVREAAITLRADLRKLYMNGYEPSFTKKETA